MLRRLSFPWLVVLGVVLAARSAPAADNVLDAVSTDAGVVIRLKNPQATLGKVAELADLIFPGAGEQVRGMAQSPGGLGAMISNPTLAGVNQEADWWVAVYPRPGDQDPQVVFIIPATDLAALKQAVADSNKFLEHGAFGVYTEDADAADQTAARLKGNGKSISGLMDKESLAVFDKGDVSIFIHVTRLVTVYRAALTEARERLTQQLENVPSEIPGAPGFNPRSLTDSIGRLLEFLYQGLDDTQSCTIAAMVSKEGLAFEDLLRFASDSKTDRFLRKSPPAPLGAVARLPNGGYGYLGLEGNLSDLMQFGMQMLGAGLGGDNQASKDAQAALSQLKDLKFGEIASYFGLGSADGGTLRTLTVSEVNEPVKIRDLTRKLFQAMQTVETGGIRQTFELQPDAEQHGSVPADVLKMTMQMGEGADQNAAMFVDRLLDALYGSEGMVTRTAYLKDKVVQTSGGGKEALDRALAAQENPSEAAGGTAPFQQARSRLQDKANLLVLFDLPGFVAKALELVAESGALPLPIGGEMFRALDLKSSYLGLSAATEPQGLRVWTSVPTEQAQGVAKIALTITQLLGGFGAPEGAEGGFDQ